jgi:hypothetical protein
MVVLSSCAYQHPAAPLTQFISDAVCVKHFAALCQKPLAKFEKLPSGSRFGSPGWG